MEFTCLPWSLCFLSLLFFSLNKLFFFTLNKTNETCLNRTRIWSWISLVLTFLEALPALPVPNSSRGRTSLRLQLMGAAGYGSFPTLLSHHHDLSLVAPSVTNLCLPTFRIFSISNTTFSRLHSLPWGFLVWGSRLPDPSPNLLEYVGFFHRSSEWPVLMQLYFPVFPRMTVPWISPPKNESSK